MEKKTTTGTDHHNVIEKSLPNKLTWQKPKLSIIGKLREIVHGGLGSIGDGSGGNRRDNPNKP